MWKGFKIISLLLVIAGAIYLVITADEPLDIYQKRPIPPLELTALNGDDISTATWALESNGPKIINLFASWCTPCLKELPVLEQLNDHLPVYGIAVMDTRARVDNWLKEHGNPYKEVGVDPGIVAAWDLGIEGVPLTLLLDATQKIVYMHKGVLTEYHIENEILPRLEKMKR